MSCACPEYLARTYRDVRDAVYAHADEQRIRPHLAPAGLPVAGVVLGAFTCRVCGTGWVEADYSSGHMRIIYLFPVPAEELAARCAAGEGLPRP